MQKLFSSHDHRDENYFHDIVLFISQKLHVQHIVFLCVFFYLFLRPFIHTIVPYYNYIPHFIIIIFYLSQHAKERQHFPLSWLLLKSQ